MSFARCTEGRKRDIVRRKRLKCKRWVGTGSSRKVCTMRSHRRCGLKFSQYTSGKNQDVWLYRLWSVLKVLVNDVKREDKMGWSTCFHDQQIHENP